MPKIFIWNSIAAETQPYLLIYNENPVIREPCPVWIFLINRGL